MGPNGLKRANLCHKTSTLKLQAFVFVCVYVFIVLKDNSNLCIYVYASSWQAYIWREKWKKEVAMEKTGVPKITLNHFPDMIDIVMRAHFVNKSMLYICINSHVR